MKYTKQDEEKVFFSALRELKEKGAPIIDIGGALNIDQLDKKFLIRILANHTKEYIGNLFCYPSSWGIPSFRLAIKEFYQQKLGVNNINENNQIFPTGGSIGAWKTFLKTHDGPVVFSEYSPSWAVRLAKMAGKEILIKESDLHGKFDLSEIKENSIIYISNPVCPTGYIPNKKWVEKELVPFCQKTNSILFVDSYAFWSGTYSFLSIDGFATVGVESISFSKEFMCPGIRVGAIIGSKELINTAMLYATHSIKMIPADHQIIAIHLLESQFRVRKSFSEVEKFVKIISQKGWKVLNPQTHSYLLIQVPDAYQNKCLELSYFLMKRHGVAVRPWYNNFRYIYLLEVILIQPKGVLLQAARQFPNINELKYEALPEFDIGLL